MKRWYVVVLSLVAMMALLAGCGSKDPVTSTENPAVSSSVTTTSEVAATTSNTTSSTSATAGDDLAAYKTKMKEWLDKYNADLVAGATVMGNIQDPLNASEQEIKAAGDYADLMDSMVRDLGDIQPPAQLSSAHSDYVDALTEMALGTNRFLQGLKDGSSSTIQEASSTLSAAVEKGTPARDALEKALGFSLSGKDAG